MTASFDLFLPTRIRFGRGEALVAVPEILGLGRRLVIVRGRSRTRAEPLLDALTNAGAECLEESCASEPDLEGLIAGLERARAFAPDAVLAIGGGAPLDFGKALAALLPAPDPDPLEHLEVVGRGKPLVAMPLPFVAVPTTAGAGSEATRNAVIAVPEHRRKVSLRDPRMLARLAIIDPSLTDGTPRDVTLASGLDAVTQVIEPYLSNRANPVTDALCRDAIPRGFAALARLVRAEDADARDDLALVAFNSGLALANAGLGAVHGIAGVLGGETGAAHGLICGLLLPPVLRASRDAAPAGSQLDVRLSEIDSWCSAALGTGIDGLADWARRSGLPSAPLQLSRERALDIARKSQGSSSMKPSSIAFSAEDLLRMLKQAGWVEDG
ncbi:iron-containing alcohol dehydrogenase [Arenibacterium sp. CAU 1754]